jgi:hypothetical protein
MCVTIYVYVSVHVPPRVSNLDLNRYRVTPYQTCANTRSRSKRWSPDPPVRDAGYNKLPSETNARVVSGVQTIPSCAETYHDNTPLICTLGHGSICSCTGCVLTSVIHQHHIIQCYALLGMA